MIRWSANHVTFVNEPGLCPSDGQAGSYGRPSDWYRETLGPYRDCPERRSVGVRGRVVGAVSIGSFELSRWRLRRTRWAMGFQSVRAGCRASLKQATERKGEPALFLNIALES